MKRGEVYWVNLDPTRGSEIKKKRPCVVISVDIINQVRRSVVVVPLSTSAKANPPIAVEVTCDNKQVTAISDQIRAVDKSRLDKNPFTIISHKDLSKIEEALCRVLAL